MKRDQSKKGVIARNDNRARFNAISSTLGVFALTPRVFPIAYTITTTFARSLGNMPPAWPNNGNLTNWPQIMLVAQIASTTRAATELRDVLCDIFFVESTGVAI